MPRVADASCSSSASTGFGTTTSDAASRQTWDDWVHAMTRLHVADVGISGQLRVQFPSLTFPNHFSMVTGLCPTRHGIVSNAFYDPLMDSYFDYTDAAAMTDPAWWKAEPVRQGRFHPLRAGVEDDATLWADQRSSLLARSRSVLD